MCTAWLKGTQGPGGLVGSLRMGAGGDIHLAVGSCFFPGCLLDLQARAEGEDSGPYSLLPRYGDRAEAFSILSLLAAGEKGFGTAGQGDLEI